MRLSVSSINYNLTSKLVCHQDFLLKFEAIERV